MASRPSDGDDDDVQPPNGTLGCLLSASRSGQSLVSSNDDDQRFLTMAATQILSERFGIDLQLQLQHGRQQQQQQQQALWPSILGADLHRPFASFSGPIHFGYIPAISASAANNPLPLPASPFQNRPTTLPSVASETRSLPNLPSGPFVQQQQQLQSPLHWHQNYHQSLPARQPDSRRALNGGNNRVDVADGTQIGVIGLSPAKEQNCQQQLRQQNEQTLPPTASVETKNGYDVQQLRLLLQNKGSRSATLPDSSQLTQLRHPDIDLHAQASSPGLNNTDFVTSGVTNTQQMQLLLQQHQRMLPTSPGEHTTLQQNTDQIRLRHEIAAPKPAGAFPVVPSTSSVLPRSDEAKAEIQLSQQVSASQQDLEKLVGGKDRQRQSQKGPQKLSPQVFQYLQSQAQLARNITALQEASALRPAEQHDGTHINESPKLAQRRPTADNLSTTRAENYAITDTASMKSSASCKVPDKPKAEVPVYTQNIPALPRAEVAKNQDSHVKRDDASSASDDDEKTNVTPAKKSRNGRVSQAEQWDTRLRELTEYRAQHGHCLVPHNYPSNVALALWVKRQRYQFKIKHQNISGKHSALSEEREAALNALGFVWDSHKAAWEEKFAQLEAYNARYGHTNVPITALNENDKQLAIWVKCQRRQFQLLNKEGRTSSSMTKDRIDRLNSLGFVWHPRKRDPMALG